MVFQGGRLYLAGYQILAMGFLQGTLARYYKNYSVAAEDQIGRSDVYDSL